MAPGLRLVAMVLIASMVLVGCGGIHNTPPHRQHQRRDSTIGPY